MEATPKEQNDILKKIFVANLSQRVEKADLYVLFSIQVLLDIFCIIFL